MNPLSQLCAFNRKKVGDLGANEIAVYLQLFMINNDNNWQEWFPAPRGLLSAMTGISSSNTIARAINHLEQKGYIRVKRGKTKQPNIYSIIPLFSSNSSTDGTNTEQIRNNNGTNAEQKGNNNGTKTGRNKRIDKNREDELLLGAYAHEDPPENLTPAEEEVKSAFEGTFHPLTKLEELDALRAYTGEYGSRAVVEAIKRADKSIKDPGKRLHLSPRYLLPVLQNPESSRGAGHEPAVRDIVPQRPPLKPVTIEEIKERRARRERGEEVDGIGAYWIQGEPPPWERASKKPEPGETKRDWFDVIKAVPK